MTPYILQSIIINKDESQLTNAITWLINNHHESITLNPIEENEKNFIIKQFEPQPDDYIVSKRLMNEEYGIYFIYYSKNIF